jgi:4'-phosphopantetheinyl transferase
MTVAIVYYVSLPGLRYAELAGRWLHRLPYVKRRTVERAPEKSAVATLAGIDLLAHGARALGHDTLDAAALVFPEGGKPHWPGGVEFSISHTVEHAVCVVTRSVRVGIDIEIIGRVRIEILRRVASSAELGLYGASARGAASLWTRKEAVLKAAGASVFEAAAVEVHEQYADFRAGRWHFCGPDVLEHCALALAFERPGVEVELRRITQLA